MNYDSVARLTAARRSHRTTITGKLGTNKTGNEYCRWVGDRGGIGRQQAWLGRVGGRNTLWDSSDAGYRTLWHKLSLEHIIRQKMFSVCETVAEEVVKVT